MIGYSNSGRTYDISTERGLGFINDAPVGSQLVGGDNSVWTKNPDGSVSINNGSDVFNVANSMGSLTNALAAITGVSDKASARSNEYAQENREWSANQSAIANEFNAAEAAKNRDWQEYMSNTAHQREVADLKAAGLNPVLSAMNGNGAAVTSGATASANMPSGSKGESDMSANSALVSVLGSMLAAQTQLANTAVSARTQEAVADKYTAMERITSEIAAMASMSNAATAAAASRYASDTSYHNAILSSGATRYAAKKSSEASKYGSDKSYEASVFATEMQKYLRQFYPNSTAGLISSGISSALEAMFGLQSGNSSGLSLFDEMFGK